MSYNGWSNYETWNVKLWIDNDPGLEEEARDMASRARDVYSLGKALRALIDDMNPIADQASLFSDLLTAALSEVNWYEIAEAYYEEEHDDGDDDQQED